MRARTTLRHLLVVVGVVAATLVPFAPPPAAADTFTDPGFATETVATLPPYTLVGMAFAPDGRMFVWQKNGVVRVIKNGQLLPTPFIDLSAKVNTYDDRGFWGLAFDPQFATNGRVFMTYTYENAGNPNSTAARTARLTRVTTDPNNPDVALPGSEVVILGSVGTPPCTALPNSADCIGSEGGSHTLGSLHFAPDGTLFVGVGDGSDGDVNSLRAQDLTSPNGKILRINPDGSAPTDNPFYDGTSSWRSKVWLRGVRNPFGFTYQPETGEIWFGDVGWNTWEEVDHGGPGSNFGWPCYEGTGPQPYFQSSFPAECGTLTGVTPPFHTYDHSVGSAVIGGPIYSGTAYPQQYRDSFYFADYSGNFIKRVTFDAAHHPVAVQTFATDVPAPVSITQGPDGLLYYLSFTTGEIRRIRYNGPVAKAAATPTYGYSPLQVAFSSAGSSVPSGTPSYLWDFGDGQTSTAANPSHTYTSATQRTFTARLTVTATGGATSVATVDVTVGSVPPTPTITAPTDGTVVLPGQVVTYRGSATDPEDGPIPGSGLAWTVLLHHNTHVHTFVGGTGTSGSFVAEDHGPIGTYSYEIVLEATDSSGLKKSTSVTVPVGTDSTPPSAPTGVTATATSPTSVGVAWTASTDNAAVSGYRVERCQGMSCTDFAQVGTPAATTFNDTGLTGATTYRYRVRAADAAGNLSDYSAVASVTTPATPPQPAGLVGAWAFDEGTGTTAADASGKGNAGTVQGATWTAAGKNGGALTFNGTSSRVLVADSASLDLTTGMTLSAWIRPTATQSGWRTIMQKETDAYFLNASSDAGPLRPAGGGTFGGATDHVAGPTASAVDAWTHVALSYDGSVVRLYVNGVVVASRALSGTIQTTTGPLWIGGNSPWGEYFQGVIDDVRVYDRALPQADIQADMGTPVQPPAPDTTAPSVPGGVSATAAGASRIDVTWTASTDDVGVAGYRVERCQGAGCTSFTQVGTPTGTSYADTGLSAGTTYRYRVRAVDAAGNPGDWSAIVSATTSTASDTVAPSAPTGLVATPVSTSRVDLAWTASTDDVGVTGYRVERCQGAKCTTWAQVATPTGTSYSDTGLAANTVYRYRVRAVDAAGNLSGYSAIVSGRTLAPDTTRPSTPTGLGATVVSPTRVDLAWTASTDNVGVVGYRVERCQGASCTTWAQVAAPTGPSYSDTGLAPATTYRYRVRAADAAGNLSTYSSIVSATTPAALDTTAPSAPSGLTATAAVAQVGLSWTASTDNVAVAGYRVERCTGTACTDFTQVGTSSGTTYTDTGLAATTTYRYRVRAVDAAGNLGDYSAAVSATTPVTPPAPTGLVGAWAFDEGTGTTTADASGKGNVGTVQGATWTTAGKNGGALTFNGTSSLVRVPDSASLDLTTAMTLSAWIRPTASQSGWRTIMQKETDAYFLNASSAAGALRPAGGGTFGGATSYVAGPTASAVDVWTHVALSYDGTTARLYVNGLLAASAATSGAVQTTASPLWIGGNSPYGEYFIGVIDDVRVYDRALSQADVQTDMGRPVS